MQSEKDWFERKDREKLFIYFLNDKTLEEYMGPSYQQKQVWNKETLTWFLFYFIFL